MWKFGSIACTYLQEPDLHLPVSVITCHSEPENTVREVYQAGQRNCSINRKMNFQDFFVNFIGKFPNS